MENRVEAVERSLNILGAFVGEETELSLAALSVRTGLYKSTILRILGSLERFGYVRRSAQGLYSLGPMLWTLGQRCQSLYDTERAIRAHLKTLRDKSGETAAYWVRSGENRICLHRENSHKAIRHHLDEGAALPVFRGASGWILQAFNGASGEIHDRIRQEGYYISRGERDPDVMAIAVPVFGHDGILAGSLSISALNSRVDEAAAEACLSMLRTHAALLMKELSQRQ